MIIYMDVDGCLADWVTGVEVATGTPASVWDTVGHGLLPTDHQAQVDEAMCHRGFWIGLARYPWAKDLYEFCQAHGKVIFCTQPFSHPESLAGKYQWLHNHFGATMNNIIMTKEKWLLANPNCILIDDNVENVQRFQYRGGHGILFPQPWNTGGLLTEDDRERTLEEVRNSIRNISRIIRWFS